MGNKIIKICISVLFVSSISCKQYPERLFDKDFVLLYSPPILNQLDTCNSGISQTITYGIRDIDTNDTLQYKKAIEDHFKKNIDTSLSYVTWVVYLKLNDNVLDAMRSTSASEKDFDGYRNYIDDSDLICGAGWRCDKKIYEFYWYTEPMKAPKQ